jgi:outer membrane protein OmpA-like peptidoglycan-associated protein
MGEDRAIREETWHDDAPERFTWNGRTGRGDDAASGRYRYALTARDRAGNHISVRTEPFLLDRRAPSATVDVSPVPFYPGADAAASTLEIAVEAEDRVEIGDIRMSVYDPEGNLFAELSDKIETSDTITWDGRNGDGELPQSARDYILATTVVDELGNESTTETTIPVGILVEEDQGGDVRFRITGIHFPPFEADFTELNDPERLADNEETLDEIAELLQQYPDQDVRVEGHAVHVFEDDLRREREQEEVLLPLSRARAEAIIAELTERGVDRNRLIAAGRGGSEPIVNHSDLEDRWQNRRVEFELAN